MSYYPRVLVKTDHSSFNDLVMALGAMARYEHEGDAVALKLPMAHGIQVSVVVDPTIQASMNFIEAVRGSK